MQAPLAWLGGVAVGDVFGQDPWSGGQSSLARRADTVRFEVRGRKGRGEGCLWCNAHVTLPPGVRSLG
jgi:hypothetical protein